MSMNMLWIGNGRVVLPDGIAENGSVLIRDGRIEEINAPRPDGVEAVDVQAWGEDTRQQNRRSPCSCPLSS